MVLENTYCNESFEDGCVSIDLNYDHVALTDIDKDGNRISGKVLRFNPENKTSGQISDEIGRIMSKVGQYCEDRKKTACYGRHRYHDIKTWYEIWKCEG